MEDGELIEWVEKNSGTLQQWISLMQFGKATFEKKPALAMELIVREAGASMWITELVRC